MKKDALTEIKALQKDVIRKLLEEKDIEDGMPRSPVQLTIIHFLLKNQEEAVYQKDLELITNNRKSTLSGILDTMEKNGVIKRVNDEMDARKKVIVLTDTMKEQHDKIHNFFEHTSKKVMKDIPSDKLEVFYEVIDMMRKNINQ